MKEDYQRFVSRFQLLMKYVILNGPRYIFPLLMMLFVRTIFGEVASPYMIYLCLLMLLNICYLFDTCTKECSAAYHISRKKNMFTAGVVAFKT